MVAYKPRVCTAILEVSTYSASEVVKFGLPLLLFLQLSLHSLMAITFNITGALLTGIVGWALWKFYQRIVVGSPLERIPGPRPDSFFTGVLGRLFAVDTSDFHKDMLATYGGVIKVKTFVGQIALLVSDPKALHHIIVKDQHIYEETRVFIASNRLAFGPGLLGTLGEQHRRQRKMLNPVFSIAHMREMVPIFYDIAHKVRATIANQVRNGPKEIELLSWMTRTALELIGQSGFGYSFDSLTEKSTPHPYAVSVKRFIPVSFKFGLFRALLPTLCQIGTRKFWRFVVEHFPFEDVQELRQIIDIMHATSVEIVETKKRALEEGDEAVERQVARGKDIMSILLRNNMEAEKDDKLSEEELVAQVSTLTFAAMDTTSSALSRIFWLLANHQDVQDKLRFEIREARRQETDSGDLPYDELVNLPYLEAICRETLRLYPPVTPLLRSATESAILPLYTPIKDINGCELTEIPIPKGTDIVLNITGSNHDPRLWGSDSYEWKPERWLEPLPEAVLKAKIPGVYSNLMTFLGGSRSCIGFKFSQLEMKVVLCLLVSSFKFSPSRDPSKQIIWQMHGITSPALASDPSKSQLPLIVELAD